MRRPKQNGVLESHCWFDVLYTDPNVCVCVCACARVLRLEHLIPLSYQVSDVWKAVLIQRDNVQIWLLLANPNWRSKPP